MEREIGLADVWKIIRTRFKLILYIIFSFVLVSGLVSFFILQPEYEATAYLYVQTHKTDNPFNDLLANQRELKMHADLLRSEQMARDVIRELNLPMTSDELLDQVQATPVKDSLVISITATDHDDKRAVAIANRFAETFQKKIFSIIKVVKVSIFEKAVEKPNPVPISPKPVKNMAIALVLGLLIGVAIVLLIDFLDQTIKTEKEVEKLFGVPVLGVITHLEKEKKVKIR